MCKTDLGWFAVLTSLIEEFVLALSSSKLEWETELRNDVQAPLVPYKCTSSEEHCEFDVCKSRGSSSCLDVISLNYRKFETD